MNKQQLKDSRNTWIIVAFTFLLLSIGFFFFGIYLSHTSYNLGIRDTLSNYTCTEKVNISDYGSAYVESFYEFVKPSVGIYSRGNTQIFTELLSINTPEATMIIYKNGSYWIKSGTEGKSGEQLAQVMLAFNSYIDGYCRGRGQ